MKNTTLCYIEKDGKYLMLHRTKKKNDENHDKWIGIGGHFEAGESPFDCMNREILEETGLTVTDLEYRGIVTFDFDHPESETQLMHLFTAHEFTGKLKSCDEGKLAWISREKLMSLPMWEGDKIFLELLPKSVPFFSLKLTYSREGALLNSDLRFTNTKPTALISACLLGTTCRYDGKSKSVGGLSKINELAEKYNLIPICPEQLGGLPTPRLPCEIRGEQVIRSDGEDMSNSYRKGAGEVLLLATYLNAKIAILKAKSPSCGSGLIYDGSFSGKLVEGDGICARFLKQNGIKVISM